MMEIPRVVYISPFTFLLIFFTYSINRMNELLILYGIILIHELCHILAAKFYGAEIEKIRVTPLGVMAKIKETSIDDTFSEIIIYSAGPFSNLIMAIGAIMMHSWFLDNSKTMSFFILGNLSLLIINLMPILPLDGGRIFKTILLEFLSFHQVISIMSVVSKITCTVIIALGVFQLFNYLYNFSLMSIGIFTYILSYKGNNEIRFAMIKEMINKKKILKESGAYYINYLGVMDKTKLIDVLKNFGSKKYLVVKVMDENMNVIGELTETQVWERLYENTAATFREVLEKTYDTK